MQSCQNTICPLASPLWGHTPIWALPTETQLVSQWFSKLLYIRRYQRKFGASITKMHNSGKIGHKPLDYPVSYLFGVLPCLSAFHIDAIRQISCGNGIPLLVEVQYRWELGSAQCHPCEGVEQSDGSMTVREATSACFVLCCFCVLCPLSIHCVLVYIYSFVCLCVYFVHWLVIHYRCVFHCDCGPVEVTPAI